jgi:hypothetical protein
MLINTCSFHKFDSFSITRLSARTVLALIKLIKNKLTCSINKEIVHGASRIVRCMEYTLLQLITLAASI